MTNGAGWLRISLRSVGEELGEQSTYRASDLATVTAVRVHRTKFSFRDTQAAIARA